MKSKIVSSVFLFLGYIALVPTSYAIGFCPGGTFGTLCKITFDDTSPVINNILTILWVLAAILSLFFIIYGGIRWITSGGDKAKLDQARGTITAAVIGLIVTFLAFFIITFVEFLFGINSTGVFTIPNLFNPTASGASGGGGFISP